MSASKSGTGAVGWEGMVGPGIGGIGSKWQKEIDSINAILRIDKDAGLQRVKNQEQINKMLIDGKQWASDFQMQIEIDQYNQEAAILKKKMADATAYAEWQEGMFWSTAKTYGDTLVNIGEASKASAEEMKGLRITAAIIDGAAAIAASWRVAMAASTPYEAAAILTALNVANTAAQIATIESQSFAMGGQARPGYAMVGEHGPEMVRFGQPGYVYDANQTRTMQYGGGAGTTITFNIAQGATVDQTSVKNIERLLLQADREGRLESFKSRLR
jgi:hypothetical protein